MNKLVKASIVCLANAKMQDNTHEIARDIVLDVLKEKQDIIDKAIIYINKHSKTNPSLNSLLVGYEIEELLQILKGEYE